MLKAAFPHGSAPDYHMKNRHLVGTVKFGLGYYFADTSNSNKMFMTVTGRSWRDVEQDGTSCMPARRPDGVTMIRGTGGFAFEPQPALDHDVCLNAPCHNRPTLSMPENPSEIAK